MKRSIFTPYNHVRFDILNDFLGANHAWYQQIRGCDVNENSNFDEGTRCFILWKNMKGRGETSHAWLQKLYGGDLNENDNFKNGKYSCVVKKCMGAILTNMAILSRGN